MVKKIAVLGAGNGGHAVSADLSLRGYEVNLFELPRFEENIQPIIEKGGIHISGAAGEGFAKLNVVTTDITQAIDRVELILFTVPAFACEMFAEICAPFIEDGQSIVILGKGGGSLVLARVLRNKGIAKDILIGDTRTFPLFCRLIGPAQVVVFARTRKVLTAAFPSKNTDKLIKILKPVFPNVIPTDNVLVTILVDFNALQHPPGTLLNAGRIESGEEFMFYPFTPSVLRVTEGLDEERLALMKALGLRPFKWDYRAHKGKTSLRLKAPSSLQHRYITEDVPCALVTWSLLGDKLGINTPIIDSIITLASCINQVDYMKDGRTLDKLGIAGLSVEELHKYVTEGEI